MVVKGGQCGRRDLQIVEVVKQARPGPLEGSGAVSNAARRGLQAHEAIGQTG